MQDLDKILNFLRFTGPTLPAKVAKNIKTDVLLASAMLSDLSAQRKVKLSHLKIGGSPLYYLPGQEGQLYNFAAGNLNPKDLATLDKLKEKKVLREIELELLEKVGLRQLKDFALPLSVRVEDKPELFWKWHLSTAEETNTVIGEILQGVPREEIVSKKETSGSAAPLLVSETVLEKALEQPKKTEVQTTIELPQILNAGEKLNTEEKPKEKAKRKKVSDELTPQLRQLFEQLRILINSEEIVRKNAEVNYLLKVPSSVGYITYFGKAKAKTRCDEKDLSAAYMEAQIKKLPLLFLYHGELTKKAQEMLETGAFENAIVKRVE